MGEEIGRIGEELDMFERKEKRTRGKRQQLADNKILVLFRSSPLSRGEDDPPMRLALEVVEAGVGGVANVGEVLVLFSQVHRVVSIAIGSRFW